MNKFIQYDNPNGWITSRNDVATFHIEWNNNLDENGQAGKQTMSFRAVLNDGTIIFGNDLIKDPNDPHSEWGVETI